MKKIIITTLLITAVTAPHAAQAAQSSWSDTITTDRPDVAESSQTVGKQRFQVEASIGYSRDTAAGTTTSGISTPTLLRYGVASPLELRIEGDFYSSTTVGTNSASRGVADIDVGLKYHAIDGGGLVPSLGFLTHLTVPSGSDSKSDNTYAPTAKILADWDLGSVVSLGTNWGVGIPARDAAGDRFAVFQYATALGAAIPGTGDRAGLFLESSGNIPFKSGKSVEHSINTGATYLFTPDLQLDMVAQFGTTQATDGFTAGIGLSWRH